MTVIGISGARARRARIREAAGWIAANVPWTEDGADWPGFRVRWPAMTVSDLAEIDAELQRRADMICASTADLGSIRETLSGRPELWRAAAFWLFDHFPEADICHPEFVEQYGRMTREELLLAAIEHRRQLCFSGSQTLRSTPKSERSQSRR
ncbi:hypothetical protein [Sphingopyxis fribergensis]